MKSQLNLWVGLSNFIIATFIVAKEFNGIGNGIGISLLSIIGTLNIFCFVLSNSKKLQENFINKNK